jgi:hypothetical protein
MSFVFSRQQGGSIASLASLSCTPLLSRVPPSTLVFEPKTVGEGGLLVLPQVLLLFLNEGQSDWFRPVQDFNLLIACESYAVYIPAGMLVMLRHFILPYRLGLNVDEMNTISS